MDTPPFSAVFRRQLRFWTFHCVVIALPSFCLAVFGFHLWRSPPAICAMLCGIGFFIVLYAALNSRPGPLSDRREIISRALRAGAEIKSWIAGFSLAVLLTPIGGLSPDLWCGALAIGLLNKAGHVFTGDRELFFISETGEGMWLNSDFLHVLAITILDGLILSTLLLMISLGALIVLRKQGRRKYFARAGQSGQQDAR